MRAVIVFCRVVVGSLFVISGLIKANDPLGFSYKLQEYFEPSALGLPFLEPFALVLASLACLAEIVLGFAVIFGGKMTLATSMLVLLTVFFGWLTYYTATCDPGATYEVVIEGVTEQRPVTCVTDCGCFGDAMKGSIGRSLTPWESFYKDLILFILILPLFFMRRHILLNDAKDDKLLLPLSLLGMAFWCWVFTWWFPILFAVLVYAAYLLLKQVTSRNEWIIAGATTVMATVFNLSCYYGLPARDYRPYSVGSSIIEGMKSAEELGKKPPVYVYEYTLVNEVDGSEIVVTDKEYMAEKWWERQEYKLDSDRTVGPIKTEDGYEPPIPDFILQSMDSEDITEQWLNMDEPYLWLVTYDVEKVGDGMSEVSALLENLDIPVLGMSASSQESIEEFRHQYQLAVPYAFGDEKVLKTIVRSNPGLVLLQNGTVIEKWPSSAIPDEQDIRDLIENR